MNKKKSLKVTQKGLTVDLTAVSTETYQIIDSLFCQEDFPSTERESGFLKNLRRSLLLELA